MEYAKTWQFNNSANDNRRISFLVGYLKKKKKHNLFVRFYHFNGNKKKFVFNRTDKQT